MADTDFTGVEKILHDSVGKEFQRRFDALVTTLGAIPESRPSSEKQIPRLIYLENLDFKEYVKRIDEIGNALSEFIPGEYHPFEPGDDCSFNWKLSGFFDFK